MKLPARHVTTAVSGRRRWRLPVLPLIAGLIAWVGMGVILYPTVAAWFSQYNQSLLIENYSVEINDGTDPGATELLREAHEYNDALSSGALLGANERVPTGAGESTSGLEYRDMLRADGLDVMARLKIPAIDVDLPVYHGTDDATLLRGVGHLEGTSLPVGGDSTRSVLTAHRGLASATLFNNLDKVEVGDTFTIEVFGEVLTYRVFDTKVVEPDETEALRQEVGRDLVTLVTCTPLGINSHRILVTGERISPTPIADLEAAGTPPDIPGFPWWIVIIVGGTVAVVAYVWYSGLPPRARRTTRAALTDPAPDTVE